MCKVNFFFGLMGVDLIGIVNGNGVIVVVVKVNEDKIFLVLGF